MLTTEIIRANTELQGLTDEQVAAITALSENDENSVIAKKTGEIYGALDADILAVTGVEKNGTEKTYDYAKRVLGDFKTKAEGATALNTQIASLTKEKARLEKVIAEGGNDKETTKQLNQAKADLASVTKQYTELSTKYEQAEQKHQSELFGLKIQGELDAASKGLKFKANLPESVTAVILAQAVEKVKGMNPEYIDNGNGGKILAFKDAQGAVLRNPSNQLNPFTASELLNKELETMGVLAPNKPIQGGGTKPVIQGGQHGDVVVDISGARTRNEAYEAITQSLMQQGLVYGSKEFDEAMSKAWKDNNISALPEK